MKAIEEKPVLKPFLRWAGGKSWLNKYIRNLNNLKYNNYHEPFLGGASTFFSLQNTKGSFLSDLNSELITTYTSLRDNVNEVIHILKDFKNTKEFYYTLRDSTFTSETEIAAKFIYLNQTSFNGIYRVNLKGIYNVPYGFRSKNFLDDVHLRNISESLKSVYLNVADFDIVRQNLQENDFVFLDPPYTVSHNNNGFIKYNEKLFSLDDQYRLSHLIGFIKEKRAHYILTNAAHDKVREIFQNGDTIHEISRANLIGGINAKRGQTKELIFTNINF